ncbi:acyl-CoA N-acyltransferase [Hortaea werneckii]|uniref:N-acetyltransferase domain-containing protein n=1 Tax=Hortaea werneckii TaxID=91943 RepID=A0A3M7BT36_HORWE|nr:acyl-CoA N-acyltransferase [Hortaea werneckii]KAI7701971.1 acyl-CoA N-acyltransferase [Hortaea werneckii]RMY42806.1 hypothetical protein D0865_11688 [Hortaea werneckii]
MPVTISSIAEQDIPAAIKCIQAAFADDPYANWVFDRETFSVERNTASLSVRCRWGMSHALFNVAKDTEDPEGNVLGVACWLPPAVANPEGKVSWWDWYGSWWLWVQQGITNLKHGRGGLNINRYHIWKEAQAKAQFEIWDDQHGYYFCNIVTVSPEAQGRGIGRLLFKHVTDQADKEGRRCYLESSRAVPNLKIYERLGFRLAREMVCDDDGNAITLYCMLRDPHGIDASR